MDTKKVVRNLLDFESSALPYNYIISAHRLDSAGRPILASRTELAKLFYHIEALQIGIKSLDAAGPIEHFSIAANSNIAPYLNGTEKSKTIKSYGKEYKALQAKAYTSTKESTESFLKRNPRLNKFKAKDYLGRYAKDVKENVFVVDREGGKKLYLSKFSLLSMIESGELDEDALIKGTTPLAKKLQSSEYGIKYTGLTHKKFVESGGLLDKVADRFLLPTRNGNISKLVGWNPLFDLEVLRGLLYKYGKLDKLEELDKAYNSGKFAVEGIEKTWQAIMYKLAEEDPNLLQQLKIHLNPVAFDASLGRVGKNVTNFKEFQLAIPWKAEDVSQLLSWHKRVASAMPEGIEIHAGGADVKLEEAMMKTLNEMFFNIKKELSNKGITINTLDDLIKEKNAGTVVSDVLKLMISKEAGAGINESSIHSFIDFEKNFSDLIKRKNSYLGDLAISSMQKKAGDVAKSALVKYGGVAVASAILAGITYNIFGDDDEIDPFGKKLKKGLGFNNRIGFSKFTGEEEKKNTHFEILKTLGYTAGLPIGGLYAIGSFAAANDAKILGRELKPKDIFRTIRYGALKLEGSIPLFRTLRLSSSMHMLAGTRSFPEEGIRRFSFTNIENNTPLTYLKHKVDFTDVLLHAKKVNGNLYSDLNDAFNPAYNTVKQSGIKTRKVKISQGKNNNSFVDVIDTITTPNGDIVEIIKPRIHVPFVIDPAKIKNTNIRMADLDFRKMQKALDLEKAITNTIVLSKTQKSLIKAGTASKKTLNEYISGVEDYYRKTNRQLPSKEWRGLWEWQQKIKYWFDLDAKGVGEGANALYNNMSNITSNVDTVLQVKTIKNTKYIFSEWLSHGANAFLESPFTTLGVSADFMKKKASQLMGSKHRVMRLLGRGIAFAESPHLGLPLYDMKYGSAEFLFKLGYKRLLPAVVAFEGLRAVDHLLGAITFSPDGRGPLTNIPIKAVEYSSLMYSKVSDILGLTSIAKRQEQVAPGSTGLGAFALPMSMISLYKGGEILYKYGPKQIRNLINEAGKKASSVEFLKRALQKESTSGILNKTTFERIVGWGLRNPKKAIISAFMIPNLPFLPGLIGSNKTYAERKAEYDGKKEVAIRKYRGWLLSSSPYAGDKVVQYRRHALNLFQSNWENRGVIWPSYPKRLLHNTTLGLYGRYMLEEYHAKDQPVYQSAPYGANIPLVGPIVSATIGRIIKPTKQLNEMNIQSDSQSGPYVPYKGKISAEVLESYKAKSSDQLASEIGIKNEGDTSQLAERFTKHFRDMIGFRGFLYESTKDSLLGEKGQYQPYAQDATELYNTSTQMWQYQLGDITVVGGEFMRRLFMYPQKIWRVNNLKNDLAGTSWIPSNPDNPDKDPTIGTTFNKFNMGWLYASKKGWEFLYPEVKGLDLEQYPDPIRLEILQQIAPYSREYDLTVNKVMDLALGNSLTPEDEQRYYETLDQVRDLKQKVYASDSEYAYNVSKEASKGTITSVRADGGFTLDAYGTKNLRLSGISLSLQDIRSDLLNKQKFDNAQELDKKAREIQTNAANMIQNYMSVGKSIDITTLAPDQMQSDSEPIEAIVGGLNEELMDIGVPFTNTGNLSKYEMAQRRMGAGSSMLAKYWEAITPKTSFWSQKLINKQTYLDDYLYNQVFNREVKLWNHPIEQLLKPAIATTVHRLFGIDAIPSFTQERRSNQEYWDIVKYVKYKMLAVQAKNDGDEDAVAYYNSMWRKTVIGADPTDNDRSDEFFALPTNERNYFDRFANEPDPKKRGKIYKFLPRFQKRIFESIWMKKQAEMSDDPKIQKRWEILKETEGWDMSEDERKEYLRETNGEISPADYIRAKVVQSYAENHPLPGPESLVWNPDIDVDDVELLALREQGENIQDYGYFDSKARTAAYNGPAYSAALEINSIHSTKSKNIGMITSMLAQSTELSEASGIPTSSIRGTMSVSANTREHDRMLAMQNGYIAGMSDPFNLISDSFM